MCIYIYIYMFLHTDINTDIYICINRVKHHIWGSGALLGRVGLPDHPDSLHPKPHKVQLKFADAAASEIAWWPSPAWARVSSIRVWKTWE